MDTNMNDGVQRFLDCSTGHIMRSDDAILSDWADEEMVEFGRPIPYRTIRHSYGYCVHVRLDGAEDRADPEAEAREEGISEAFMALQAYARERGCWWINLDRDADPIDGLPIFDWTDTEAAAGQDGVPGGAQTTKSEQPNVVYEIITARGRRTVSREEAITASMRGEAVVVIERPSGWEGKL